MRTEIVKCDLCGSEDFTVIWDKQQREKSNQLASAVIRDENGKIVNGTTAMCEKCGLVCINPRMDEVETEKFYAEKYRDTYEIDEVGEKYHAKKAFEFLTKFLPLNKKQFKTLDIGCASGYLVEMLQDIGCASYGCEQNKATADISINRNLKVFNNRIEDLKENGFDLVTILNTLEHMHSPTTTLKKIREIMNDNGCLFIIVPNLYNTTAKMSGDAFMSNAHLFHFDVDTIKQYMNKCGFEVLNLTVVPEFNMDKLYLLAKKTEVKEISVDYEVNPQRIYNMIGAMDYLFMINWLKMNTGGKK